MTRTDDIKKTLESFRTRCLDAGLIVAVPERLENDRNKEPYPWLYVSNGKNVICISLDTWFCEVALSFSYVPSRENGAQCRLNGEGQEDIDTDVIKKYLDTLNTPQDLKRINKCLTKLHTLRFYKDFEEFANTKLAEDKGFAKYTICRPSDGSVKNEE